MHLTAGNSIPAEENSKNSSNSKHDNNDIGIIKKCNGQTFSEERAMLIDTCHVRCAVVQIMRAFIYICKELNGKKKIIDDCIHQILVEPDFRQNLIFDSNWEPSLSQSSFGLLRNAPSKELDRYWPFLY